MSSIKVAVRCRPLFDQERAATGLDMQGRRILLDSKTYDPDYTFSPSSTQDDVLAACTPILQCVKDGLNGTLMVYGQTGTGKTYTMQGSDGEDNGLVHKVIAHMLDHVQQKTLDGAQCALTLSMIEIYNERLTDMLSVNGEQEVTLLAGFPRAATKITLGRLQDANEALKKGLACRHTAATLMNERSSRSHVVFIVDLEEHNAFTETTDVAHLFLVDLAGSESIKKSQASGSTAGEAGKINKSLLALKSVFLALSNTNEATRPAHVPYRDSRLTELLQDSIGGSARTLMIACISAVGRDIEETKSTLMYAVKARSIRNAANTEKEKLLIRVRSMEVENQRLRNRLQERVNERGGYYITKEEHEHYEVMEEEAKELKENVEQLMKDSQASDARKHISESQVKILQGLFDDKEDELQQMKALYHDALQRFERNASTLHRFVQTSLGELKGAADSSTAERHDRLCRWRSQMTAMLEASPDAMLPCAASPLSCGPDAPVTEDEEQQQQQQPCAVETFATPLLGVSPQKTSNSAAAPTQHSTRGSLASQRGGGSSLAFTQGASQSRAGSRPGSPGRRAGPRPGSSSARRPHGLPLSQATGREKEREVGPMASVAVALAGSLDEEAVEALALSCTASPTLPAAAPSGPIATEAVLSPTQPSKEFLQEADARCQRVVEQTNAAFTVLLTEAVEAYARLEETLAQVAATQQQKNDQVAAGLRRSVEECIAQWQRSSALAAEGRAEAQDAMRGRLRILSRQYGDTAKDSELSVSRGPCAVQPLQAIVRDACLATVRDAERVFPPREAPESVRLGCDRIVAAYQGRVSAWYAQAVEPLGSLASSPRGFQALLTSSEQQQKMAQAIASGVDVPPLPMSVLPVSPVAGAVAAAATRGVDGGSTGAETPLASPRLAHHRSGSISAAASQGGGESVKENAPPAGASRGARASLRTRGVSSSNAPARPISKRTRSSQVSARLSPRSASAVAELPESGRRPSLPRVDRK